MSVTLYPAETNSGTVTSFIPLTTTWTASPGCSNSFRLDGPSLMAFDPGYGLDINTNVICDPPAVTTWWEQGLLGGGGQYKTDVSIGPLTCPEGFSTVASSVKDTSSTLAMCCPSEYFLEGGAPGQVQGNCLSRVSSGMTLTYASTPYTESTSWSIVTTTMSSQSIVGAIAVMGWNINNPRTVTSTSMPTSESKSSTSRSTSATASTSVTTSTSANASTSVITSTGANASTSVITSTSATASTRAMNSTSDGGLATGAKVGIGVGVGVGGIGVIALLVAFYFFRRRQQQTIRELPESRLPAPNPGTSMSQVTWQSAWPSELSGSKYFPGEGSRSPAELEGEH